jgi:hypothetical protein
MFFKIFRVDLWLIGLNFNSTESAVEFHQLFVDSGKEWDQECAHDSSVLDGIVYFGLFLRVL